MKFKNLELNNTNNTIDTWENEALAREFLRPQANRFKINLMELSNVVNPSDVRLTITNCQSQVTVIHLHRFRTEFLFQNGVFIWNTKAHHFFDIDVSVGGYFALSVESKSGDFNMALYGETDQESGLDDTLYV
jgi:hypothetical protein